LSNSFNAYFSEDVNEITQIVGRKFYILDVNFPSEYGGATVSITVIPQEEEKLEEYFREVEKALVEKGYIAFLRKPEEYAPNYLLIVAPFSPPSERAKYWSFASLAVTSGTVFLTGYLMAMAFDITSTWVIALGFTISLLGIIGLHELGHLVASKLHGVKADLPIFIPMLPPYGTLGAIIRQRSPPVDRKSLFDLGIAGPLVSFLVSIVASIIGLTLSKVHVGKVEGVLLPPPLLFEILVYFLVKIPPGIPPNAEVVIMLHPIAFAGWLGMLITAINLFPVGQLDGGHVARALFDSKTHQYVSYIAVLILLGLGYYLFAIIALFLAMARHPGPLNDVSKLDKKRKILGFLALFGIIVLCLPELYLKLELWLRALSSWIVG